MLEVSRQNEAYLKALRAIIFTPADELDVVLLGGGVNAFRAQVQQSVASLQGISPLRQSFYSKRSLTALPSSAGTRSLNLKRTI